MPQNLIASINGHPGSSAANASFQFLGGEIAKARPPDNTGGDFLAVSPDVDLDIKIVCVPAKSENFLDPCSCFYGELET